MTKIYTKTGDKGETSLFGGERVAKDNERIEAYGSVDELNSLMGIIRSLQPSQKINAMLENIQNDLFIVGADLATPNTNTNSVIPHIAETQYQNLEKNIDVLEEKLSPLTSFILPGGTTIAAQLHFVRTVCRRAERCVVKLSHLEKINNNIIIYLNRLSDLLFVMARYENHINQKKEQEWKSGKR